MSASLVGSEMCIRDSRCTARRKRRRAKRGASCAWTCGMGGLRLLPIRSCLLYTSDAADDM
eukprot:13224025-Alexandrium_andersonii.AAC.1